MSEEQSDSILQFSGIGGVAIICGVVSCIGLKVVGGAVLLGGLATMLGITADQTTFLVGGLGGTFLAGLVLTYRRFDGLDIRSS